uniref:hypothetical protein n=1 Tax=Fulvivirga sp. TaxID=1931237 RepID=UPI00404A35AD
MELLSPIKEYLSKPTSHSVLLKGSWGSGKTFHLRHELAPKIEEIETLSIPKKTYKVIMVSLYGVSTVDEILYQVFTSIFPLLKDKKVKIAMGLAKSLARVFLQTNSFGKIDDYLGDQSTDSSTFLKLDELLICLDDLERKASSLDYKTLIGFVNDLVENKGGKVLIIANDDKIEDEEFKSLKEKTIGITYEFPFDLEKSYNSIVEQRFESNFSDFSNFLKSNSELILSLLEHADRNLRKVIFALDKLHNLYADYLKSDQKTLENKEIRENLIRFVISLALEFKNDLISLHDSNGLNRHIDLDMATINLTQMLIQNASQKKEEQEKSFDEKFIDKYYGKRKFIFIKSLYEHITGGMALRSRSSRQINSSSSFKNVDESVD